MMVVMIDSSCEVAVPNLVTSAEKAMEKRPRLRQSRRLNIIVSLQRTK